MTDLIGALTKAITDKGLTVKWIPNNIYYKYDHQIDITDKTFPEIAAEIISHNKDAYIQVPNDKLSIKYAFKRRQNLKLRQSLNEFVDKYGFIEDDQVDEERSAR